MPTVFDRNSLHVDATLSDGDLLISGHDLNGFLDQDEYEYLITLPASQFSAVRNALGASTTAGVIGLMVARGEQIVTSVEQKWFTEHGIDCRVQTYS